MDRHVKRDYESDEIIVHWDSAKCIHCGRCAMGLPSVFNPKNHPWVDINGAGVEEIQAQVEKCPSGALSFMRKV